MLYLMHQWENIKARLRLRAKKKILIYNKNRENKVETLGDRFKCSLTKGQIRTNFLYKKNK